MWGRRPNSESTPDFSSQTQSTPDPTPRSTESDMSRPAGRSPVTGARPVEGPEARLGKRLTFRGEITGNEDLQIDGDCSGKIELKDNCLTIGPNALVEADVHARSIQIAGRLKGNVQAPERIELRKTGSLEGDVVTAGIVIERARCSEGASIL